MALIIQKQHQEDFSSLPSKEQDSYEHGSAVESSDIGSDGDDVVVRRSLSCKQRKIVKRGIVSDDEDEDNAIQTDLLQSKPHSPAEDLNGNQPLADDPGESQPLTVIGSPLARRPSKTIDLERMKQKYRNLEMDVAPGDDGDSSSSSSDEADNENSDNDAETISRQSELREEVSLDNIIHGKRKQKSKTRKPKKAELVEMESEQQRLLRDQTIKIQYHQPAAKPIEDFLRRVPKLRLKTTPPKKVSSVKPGMRSDNPLPAAGRLFQLLSSAPRLTSPSDFKEEDVVEDVLEVEKDQKLGIFMKRLVKHTATHSATTKPILPDDHLGARSSIHEDATEANQVDWKDGVITFDAVKNAKTPGGRLEALRGELKTMMRKERKQQRDIMESQQQIDNEDFSHDEDSAQDSNPSSDEASEAELLAEPLTSYKTKEQGGTVLPLCERTVDKMQATEDTQDVEVEKWNDVEARTQLERELDKSICAELEDAGHLMIEPTPSHRDDGMELNNTSASSCEATDGASPDAIPDQHLDLDDNSTIPPWQEYVARPPSASVSASDSTSAIVMPSHVSPIEEAFTALPPVTASITNPIPIEENAQFTQILNSQGFLKPAEIVKPTATRRGLFDATPSCSTIGEALRLCSGGFGSIDQSLRSDAIGLPTDLQQPDRTTCDLSPDSELIGLCSGSFDNTIVSPLRHLPLMNSQPAPDDNEELLALCSGTFTSKANGERSTDHDDGSVHGDDDAKERSRDQDPPIEDADDNDSLSAANDMDDDGMREQKLQTATAERARGLNKMDFIEDEAELSGSEAASDEDDDLGSEYDEYEAESDAEELPSHQDLKEQVNKVHLKSVFDADQRELRRYQEMFLDDGDLHVDGQGRRRNFRWRNIDNATLDAMARHHDNDSNDDEPSFLLNFGSLQDDGQKRKERFERETFLRETEDDATHLDEDSQVILNLVKDTSNLGKPDVDRPTAPLSVPSQAMPGLKKRSGSFLSRGKIALARLSSLTSSASAAQQPKRAAFVFQAVSPTATDNPTPSALRRTQSHEPASKRRRLHIESKSSKGDSVFALLPH